VTQQTTPTASTAHPLPPVASAVLPSEDRIRQEDRIRDEEHAAFEEQMRGLGQFIDEYGQPALWTAIYLRLGCDIRTGGWSLSDGFYRPGDEWRFVYGPSGGPHHLAAIEQAR